MNIRIVPLLAALVPFAAVHLTYLVAASNGQVDWCFPYLDSCTSISATGGKPPASYLFRATMLPSAVIMMVYWWFSHGWLASLNRRAGRTTQSSNHWMLGLGLLACVGLVMYVTVLGERGDAWATQRRVGTILFFSFTYLAQLMLTWQLRKLHLLLPSVPGWLPLAMLLNCLGLLALGLLTVVLAAWDAQWYKSVEDAFEWVLSLLLQINFLLGYLVWRRANWSLRISSS